MSPKPSLKTGFSSSSSFLQADFYFHVYLFFLPVEFSHAIATEMALHFMDLRFCVDKFLIDIGHALKS